MTKTTYFTGAAVALLWAWFIISFADVVINNTNGANYLPFNFFEMLAGGFAK